MSDEAKILEASITPNGAHIMAEHPVIAELVKGCVQMFEQTGATNFLSMSLMSNAQAYDLTLQKQGAESVAQQLTRLKTRIKELTEIAMKVQTWAAVVGPFDENSEKMWIELDNIIARRDTI